MFLKLYSIVLTIICACLLIHAANGKAVPIHVAATAPEHVLALPPAPAEAAKRQMLTFRTGDPNAVDPAACEALPDKYPEALIPADDRYYVDLCYTSCPKLVQDARVSAKMSVQDIASRQKLTQVERKKLEQQQMHEQLSYCMGAASPEYNVLTAGGANAFERALGEQRGAELQALEQASTDSLVAESELALAEYLGRRLGLDAQKKDELRTALLDEARYEEAYLIGISQTLGLSGEQETLLRTARQRWSNPEDLDTYIESSGGIAALADDEVIEDPDGTRTPYPEAIRNRLILKELADKLPPDLSKRLKDAMHHAIVGMPSADSAIDTEES